VHAVWVARRVRLLVKRSMWSEFAGFIGWKLIAILKTVELVILLKDEA